MKLRVSADTWKKIRGQRYSLLFNTLTLFVFYRADKEYEADLNIMSGKCCPGAWLESIHKIMYRIFFSRMSNYVSPFNVRCAFRPQNID